MLSRILFFSLLLYTHHAWSASLAESYMTCFNVPQDSVRLLCYDKIREQESTLQNAILPVAGQAPDTGSTEQTQANRVERFHTNVDHDQYGLLTSNNPNYFVWASPVEDDLADDGHLEFYLSLKYPMVEQTLNAWKTRHRETAGASDLVGAALPDRLLFIYNAQYDFYLGPSDRYSSSPILSRMQNPGIAGEWDFGEGEKKLRLGWFHESNGQELGAEDLNRFQALDEENGGDFALSRASRGWDYAQVRFENSSLNVPEDHGDDRWWRYQFEYRLYCNCQAAGFDSGREDDIWWDAGNDARISDYDGLRFMGERSYTLGENIRLLLRAELKTGSSDIDALTNIGGRLSLVYKWRNIRASAFYFNGYGKEPSTYHKKTGYFGLGLELR